jgi:hypothetical protein
VIKSKEIEEKVMYPNGKLNIHTAFWLEIENGETSLENPSKKWLPLKFILKSIILKRGFEFCG